MLAVMSVAPSIIPELCRFTGEAWISQDGPPVLSTWHPGNRMSLLIFHSPQGAVFVHWGLCV